MNILNPEQRTILLRIARESIAAVLDGSRPDLQNYPTDDVLCRPAGAFVTLSQSNGELRGCIGSLHPVAPLYQAVSMSAINAAFRDPRFYPVKRDELPGLHVEISVMGPIERVQTLEDIMVGRDGLIVTRGHFSGLLLPQVATEYGWDLDTFLGHTCLKAGLPVDAWRSGETRIERFAAEVFGEQTAESA